MRINTRLSPLVQLQYRVPERRSLGTRLHGLDIRVLGGARPEFWVGPGDEARLDSRYASVPEVIHFLLPCPVSVYHSAPPPQFSAEILPELLPPILRNDKEIGLQKCLEK